MFLELIFQYLMFSSEMVKEIITVLENGFDNLFLDVLRLVREYVLGENAFCSVIWFSF